MPGEQRGLQVELWIEEYSAMLPNTAYLKNARGGPCVHMQRC